ncbi:MAG: MFS transporter [Gemmatimonadota bacterium]|nr:MAG: MFS transporter [Gemmatimonadota bacterium]
MERVPHCSQERYGIQKGQIALLTTAHLINDTYAGFLAPLLPVVVEKFGLTMAATGFLSSVLAVSSSLAQPLYGYLADRLGRRYFVVLGPLLTSIFMSSIGLPRSYGLLVLVIFMGGMGTAFFHPQGAALAGAAGGYRKGLGMSIFSAGGNAGYALGPLLIIPIVSIVGFENTFVAVIPGVIISMLLYKYIARAKITAKEASNDGFTGWSAFTYRPLLYLWLIVFLRATVVTSFGTFIPLLLEERGYSLMVGGTSIFVFLFCGAVGGLFGGYWSDRIGRKKIILMSLGLSTPFLFVFLYTSGLWTTLGLALAGMVLLSSIPVGIVMAQEFMPTRISTVSGLMMGFGWGLGGLAVSFIGMLADHIGLTPALAVVALIPLIGFGCGLRLPDE